MILNSTRRVAMEVVALHPAGNVAFIKKISRQGRRSGLSTSELSRSGP